MAARMAYLKEQWMADSMEILKVYYSENRTESQKVFQWGKLRGYSKVSTMVQRKVVI